jgi:hypothetical protein
VTSPDPGWYPDPADGSSWTGCVQKSDHRWNHWSLGSWTTGRLPPGPLPPIAPWAPRWTLARATDARSGGERSQALHSGETSPVCSGAEIFS